MQTEAMIIPPSQIESELTRIWESLQSANKLRACLFNVIIYTQNNHRSEYFRMIAKHVIEKFPSRIIFIAVNKAASQDYLKTSVSVISPGIRETDIACDMIEFEVSSSEQNRIPFVILPHILPDLPVYFVWGEDPIQADPIPYQLEKFATRMIFDSESTTDLPHFAKFLLHYKEESQCEIADLNWARIESWRNLLFLTFHSEEKLAQLNNLRSIQITYNEYETPFFCHTHIQAVYLQAWLACQLQWQLNEIRIEKKKPVSFSYKTKEPITVTLISSNHPNLAPGILISLDLITDKDQVIFTRNLEYPQQIGMKTVTQEKCEIPSQLIFAKAEVGQSLVREISRKGTSDHFLKVLQFISTLEQLRC